MRKLFTLLLISATFLSACKKENADEQVQQYLASKQTNSLSSSATTSTTTTSTAAVTNLISSSLRIKLIKDSVNYDGTLINFNATAKATYVIGEDAPYFPGFGLESLSSLSSDKIALAINTMPLPTKSTSIALKVTGKADGIYKLTLTTVKAIPAIFNIWLMDNYKKDSLDFRNNPSYSFNLYVADTTSYGSKRFSLVIRQNTGLAVHLLSFTAIKGTSGVQTAWTVENEFNYTGFSVERSSNGASFNALSGITSSATGTYSYLDKTPAAGADYYRLKMTDLNGTVTYSSVVAVEN